MFENRSFRVFTEIREIDQATKGFLKGQLIMIAGKKGMGIHSFMLSVLYNLLMKDRNCGYLAFNRTSQEILEMLIIQAYQEKLEFPLSEEDEFNLNLAFMLLEDSPLFIRYFLQNQETDLKRIVQTLRVMEKCRIVFVDKPIKLSNQDLYIHEVIELKQIAVQQKVTIFFPLYLDEDHNDNDLKQTTLKHWQTHWVDHTIQLNRPVYYDKSIETFPGIEKAEAHLFRRNDYVSSCDLKLNTNYQYFEQWNEAHLLPF